MSNSENKKEIWERLYTKYNHLESYCQIDLRGLDDDSIYYHIDFKIDDNTFISSQGDVNNKYIYALRFNSFNENNFSIEISEELIDPIIVGYFTNKDIVMLALNTLAKIRQHIQNLNTYTTDYIVNVLIGNSIDDVTKQFISELKTVNGIVSFMQKNKA